MEQGGVEEEEAADVAADVAQGLARRASAPLPAFAGEQTLPSRRLLGEAGQAFGFGAFGRGGGWRQFAGVAVPVGGAQRGLFQGAVRLGRGGPELQEVAVQLGLVVQPGVLLARPVHALGAVPHPVVGLLQAERPGGLARPLHERAVRRHRTEGHLHHVFPDRVQRRGLLTHLDREADAAGVQAGAQPEGAR
ncbi:hypothetical protein GCM10010304_73770 [Streptomyces roseoviolaceus]